MELFFRKYGKGFPLIILHGLYGSSDNWVSIAKRLSNNFEVFLIDQRNHGRSPHTEKHTYKLMIEDLREFFEQQNIEKAIITGHSMGGKTAMHFAKAFPQKIEKLIVIDISPKPYIKENIDFPIYDNHQNIISAMLDIDLKVLKSRKQADDILSKKIEFAYVRQFLLKNLYRKKDKSFAWRINISIIYKSLPEMMKGFDTNETQIVGFPVMFVRGDLSGYIKQKDIELIEKLFPDAKIVTINNASHWLHAEYPEKLLQYIIDFE